eukprot:CAMPEP_0114049580 /NCGR_PEP_ID=MMETSP1339-20121228/58528_1 /TAXON_ID=94617 /ORGANISM="Fibrocapsa japonica" /LENGTH=45 /assembly_acc=CAM_ASM_000762
MKTDKDKNKAIIHAVENTISALLRENQLPYDNIRMIARAPVGKET